ncbi:MAG: methionine adenosyltransferase [Bacteroidetes bacterium]|nr:methionine adenosyltransferase [Bacteroidota bacterium]MBT3933500.1 methionine adenosyltransferase [Bacteroidota bacterium]MBT7038848.1 methionine adenosyltransferase [Bacteroidota bacterium]
MPYLFTSESVSEGHPDKVSDQISDALLDSFLKIDPNSKVACETFVTTGLVVAGGEVRTQGYVEIQDIVRKVVKDIGYTKAEYQFDSNSCGIISTIHSQSDDIYRGVDRGDDEKQGAGDQGMMFGYACTEMDNYMPIPIELSHMLVQELAAIRKEGKKMKYLRPDSKSQVTVEYSDNNKPLRIHTIVVSTQHDDFDQDDKMQQRIKEDVEKILIPRVKKLCPNRVKRLFNKDVILHVNPTGNFVIGGPHGDTGLTGRKIIVDTYGGRGAHGGGAFSGKDPSKVDRSAAYATRHIAKNMVAAGVCEEILVQVAYAIGVAEPVGIYVNTNGTCKLKGDNGKKLKDGVIAERIKNVFDLKPSAIIKRFGLKDPIYQPTAAYGHFGRDVFEKEVTVYYDPSNPQPQGNCYEKSYTKKIEFFGWEKLDYVEAIQKEFGL